MKKFVILLAVIFMIGTTINAFSQKKAAVKPDFEKTMKVKDVKSDELRDRAEYWLKSFYTNDDNLIVQKEGKGGNLNLKLSSKLAGNTVKVEYTIGFSFRDGEYSYKITSLTKSPEYSADIQEFLKTISQRIERMMVSNIPK
jgi:hypothetical protein